MNTNLNKEPETKQPTQENPFIPSRYYQEMQELLKCSILATIAAALIIATLGGLSLGFSYLISHL